MKNINLKAILVFVLLSPVVCCLFSSSISAAPKESGAQTRIQAEIPALYYLRIFGYTAPNSIVQAESIRVFGQTMSDAQGYFIFYDLPISQEAIEVCISTVDSDRRVGVPLCIILPHDQISTEIGPLLLSPTLSLSNPNILQDQTVFASGRTIPNEDVYISFFELIPQNISQNINSMANKVLNFQANASDLPILSAKSDAFGEYSVTLPTSKSLGYRLFAKASYKKQPTPKSQTLKYEVISTAYNWFYLLLPLMLLLLVLAIITAALIYYDKKTGKISKTMQRIIQRQLKPAGVRLYLKLKRLEYNFQDLLRSHRR